MTKASMNELTAIRMNLNLTYFPFQFDCDSDSDSDSQTDFEKSRLVFYKHYSVLNKLTDRQLNV